jgi:hypothetical protein
VVVSDTDNCRAPSNKRQEISEKTIEIQTAFFISTTYPRREGNYSRFNKAKPSKNYELAEQKNKSIQSIPCSMK